MKNKKQFKIAIVFRHKFGNLLYVGHK